MVERVETTRKWVVERVETTRKWVVERVETTRGRPKLVIRRDFNFVIRREVAGSSSLTSQ